MYYLLGAHNEQLAVYHRQQDTGNVCSDTSAGVSLYPTEYLTYGVAHGVSIMTNPSGGKEYRIGDHVGSVRSVVGISVQGQDYEPFGGRLGSGVTGLRTGYIDRERDRETTLGDHGSRKYETETGRFTSVDRLFEKYPSVSDYSYGANNPLTMVDPGGDSIIVLLDMRGASHFGHAAVLIGNEKDGWGLYSKNGGELGIAGKSVGYQIAIKDDGDRFENLAEFRASEKSTRYTHATLIPAGYKADAKMIKAAIKTIKEDYKLLSNSCIDAVSDALEAGGFMPGQGTATTKSGYIKSVFPTDRYFQILIANRRYGAKEVTKEVLKELKNDD